MGQYDNNTQRQTLASAANSYYVDLSTYFQQAHIPLLDNNTDIQIGFIWILWPIMPSRMVQQVILFLPLTLVMQYVSFQGCTDIILTLSNNL